MPNRIGSALVDSTAEPAVAIDEHMTIVGWNAGAERLFGRPADDVLGKPCNEIVSGLDAFGNRYCDERCVLMKMVQCREPVHRMRLDIPLPGGGCSRSDVVTLRLPGARPSAFTLVHVFLPERASSESSRRGCSRSDPPEGAAIASLTPREREILQLLTEGVATREIAAALSITQPTVRNHVQHLLNKLGMHSKTAAVSFALRHGLL